MITSKTTTHIKPFYLLCFISIIVPITFITTYTITEVIGDDDQIIPYISDTIDFAPESCIGTFGLSIIAFLMIIIVFIKHLIVKNNIVENEYSDDKREKKQLRFNRFSTSMGFISGLSMHGVSSFQFHNANLVHIIFAALFFLCGFIYLLTQTILDNKTSNNIPLKISIIRKILICISCLFIAYIITQFFIDNLAAIFEIISALSIFAYIITFFYEFSNLTLNIEFNKPIKKLNASGYCNIENN
ncbi:hypothetical protein RB653_010359 [Dictyostelium firmibasis]|uniref:CWH43-like N-terminal domain-containing protein n=1 Tax=Dictyostelium firmibasis TaxID=79012 RepID=A0AAN7U161_9MYCE